MTYGKITNKQREVLEYLKQQVLQKGYPPSVREICDAVGLKSTSSVHAHLESLERNGYIRKDPTKPRAIEIVDDGFNLVRTETVYIPEVGKVAAGQPILAVENIDAYLPFPAYMIPQGKEVFVLTVKGDSMVEAGIFDGDKLVVAKQSTAQNGEIVVALVDDSATVKTFYKEDGYYRLQPENPTLLLNLAVYFDSHQRNRAEARKYYTRFLNMTRQNSSMSRNREAVEKRMQALR